MEVLTEGSKYDIHMWQRQRILDYLDLNLELPSLNINGW